MSADRFIRIACFGLIVLGVGISGYYRSLADRRGGNLPDRPTGKVANPVRAGFGLVTLAAFGVALVSPEWAAWLSLPVPLPLRWFGLAVVGAMVPLIWWTLRTIGTNVSPTTATRAGARLVTSGPYRWIRHPIYTAGTGLLVGAAVALGSWILIGLLAGLAAFLPDRVRQEEAQLIDSFGDRYRRYVGRTGRFLPKLGAQPEEKDLWKSN